MTFTAHLWAAPKPHWRMAAAMFVLACGLCTGVSAQSVYKDSRINAFGRVFEAPKQVADHQTRLFFYRLAQHSSVKGAASIYVNGAYHASLVAGAYSQLCMPAGDIELGLKSVEVGRQVRDKLDTITIDRSQAGQNHYFRVKEVSPERQVLMVVPPAQALAEIQGTKEQIHTISRVVSAAECAIKPPPAVQPVAIPAAIPAVIPAATPAKGQTITLAADALFAASAPAATAKQAQAADQAKPATGAGGQQISLSADAPFAFGRSDLDAISPHGRASLDEMVKRLTSEYSQIDSMHVVGHADPIGRAAVNDRLSVKRAQTVRDYLQQTGLPNVQITSDGKGSREPVVTHCDNAPTPEAISCHAPNRRVVIDIVGTRR